MPAHDNRRATDELLFEILQHPESAWPDQLERVCNDRPAEAFAIRRRFEMLKLAGVVESRAPTRPERVGSFRILRELGSGGMGVVYLAEQPRTQRKVALKLIRHEQLFLPRVRQRFLREVEIAARLAHPNVCMAYEAGDAAGVPFIAMQYIEGQTLAQVIAHARANEELPSTWSEIRDILGIFAKLAGALHAAHSVRLVHRDIKPGNIMIAEDGEPVILDFGLAWDESDADGNLTLSGAPVGTPAYMAPEQIEPPAAGVDRRADVYALAVTLYERLTLHCPFAADTREAVYKRILSGDHTPPRALNPRLPKDVIAVLEKGMHRDPERRYETADAFREDLTCLCERRPVRARPTGRVELLARWYRRHPGLASAISAACLVLVCGLLFALASLREVRESERRTRALGLAHAAALSVRRDPMLALDLALEGVALDRSPETVAQVQFALAHVHELRVIRGCLAGERRAALAPTGDAFVTIMNGGAARVWDRNGNEKSVIRPSFAGLGAPPRLRIVDREGISAAGDLLVGLCTDKTARVWSIDGRERSVLPGPQGDNFFFTAVLSPDGSRALTAADDRTARLWDSSTGKQRARLDTPPASYLPEHAIEKAVFSPDGSWIVTSSSNGTALLWHGDGTPTSVVFRGHTGAILVARFSKDGLLATASTDKTARLWNLDGEPVAVLRGHEGFVAAVDFQPGGDLVLTSSRDHTARLWHRNGNVVDVLRGHSLAVDRAEFSADGKRILTGSHDNTARLWDLHGRTLAVFAGHTGRILEAQISGDRVFTTSRDGSARVWDTSPPMPVLREDGSRVNCAVWSPDGRRVLTTSAGGTARFWTPSGKATGSSEFEKGIPAATWSRDGQRIVVALSDGTARLLDSQGTQLASLGKHESNYVLCAAFSPDGGKIATGSAREVALWDRDGRRLHGATGEIRHGRGRVVSVCFSPDGTRLVTASDAPPVRMWDTATGRLVRDFPGAKKCAVFSPDGTRLLTGYRDRTACLWDLDGNRVQLFDGHTQEVVCVAFSLAPNDPLVATASTDGTARICSLDGRTQAIVTDPGGAVRCVQFSPDSTRILTVSDAARIWLVHTDDVLRVAIARRTRRLSRADRRRFAELLDGR